MLFGPAESVLADEACITGDGEGGESPADPREDPGASEVDPTPIGCGIRSPVIGLICLDDRNRDVDGVAKGGETRVVRCAERRLWHTLGGTGDLNRHHHANLLRTAVHTYRYDVDHQENPDSAQRFVAVFDRDIQ